nr:glycine cleavage complex T protein [Paratrimastix pyriformis]
MLSKLLSLPTTGILERFSSHVATKKTPFYDLHMKFGGDVTDFCGYYLPIKYANSDIGIEHMNTRKKCTIFDVSHMGQFRLSGAGREEFMERLIVADVRGLSTWSTKLSVFTNYRGGISDDMMCTKCPNHLYLVVNAACKEKDWNHIQHHLDLWKQDFPALRIEDLSNARGLLAIQGPNAMKVLQRYTNVNLAEQPFMSQRHGKIAGVDCFITRCGYTGEDGFEISIPKDQCMRLGEVLTRDRDVTPAGLGSRDSLRLEAGLCLYGHEINDESTPIEGGLKWLIPKKRQEQGGFLGDDVILQQIRGERPLRFMRCGLEIKSGAPAREQTAVYDFQGLKQVGEVRSGLFAPSLGHPVAQAWMLPSHMEPGTELKVRVRGRFQNAVVREMPFVKKPFYRVPKKMAAKKCCGDD